MGFGASIASDLGGHDGAEGLTSRVPHIHSTTTPDEVIQVQTATFLDALADMALSVAKRLLGSGREGEAA